MTTIEEISNYLTSRGWSREGEHGFTKEQQVFINGCMCNTGCGEKIKVAIEYIGSGEHYIDEYNKTYIYGYRASINDQYGDHIYIDCIDEFIKMFADALR